MTIAAHDFRMATLDQLFPNVARRWRTAPSEDPTFLLSDFAKLGPLRAPLLG
jgi:hypothetical protein